MDYTPRRCPTCVGTVIFLTKTICDICGSELVALEPDKEYVVKDYTLVDERLDESRKFAMALSGFTDTIYLGDCIRVWTDALREEQELSRRQMREGLEHSKEVLAFQKSVFEGAHDDT